MNIATLAVTYHYINSASGFVVAVAVECTVFVIVANKMLQV